MLQDYRRVFESCSNELVVHFKMMYVSGGRYIAFDSPYLKNCRYSKLALDLPHSYGPQIGKQPVVYEGHVGIVAVKEPGH